MLQSTISSILNDARSLPRDYMVKLGNLIQVSPAACLPAHNATSRDREQNLPEYRAIPARAIHSTADDLLVSDFVFVQKENSKADSGNAEADPGDAEKPRQTPVTTW